MGCSLAVLKNPLDFHGSECTPISVSCGSRTSKKAEMLLILSSEHVAVMGVTCSHCGPQFLKDAFQVNLVPCFSEGLLSFYVRKLTSLTGFRQA